MNYWLKERNTEGFTLLEIVIALAILTIGLVGVLSLFPVGLRASKRAGDFTSAALAAQHVIETIKRAGYDIYTATGGPGSDGWYRPASDWTEPPGYTYDEGGQTATSAALPEGFSWAAAVTTTAATNLYQVSLSIYWLDRGDYQEENFVTYLADYD